MLPSCIAVISLTKEGGGGGGGGHYLGQIVNNGGGMKREVEEWKGRWRSGEGGRGRSGEGGGGWSGEGGGRRVVRPKYLVYLME